MSEGASDMDIDRAFLKELHSLKDRVSDSMLVGMVNHGAEAFKNSPEFPKNFGKYYLLFVCLGTGFWYTGQMLSFKNSPEFPKNFGKYHLLSVICQLGVVVT